METEDLDKEILLALREMGVSKILFRFDGSGDEGSIEDISFKMKSDAHGVVAKLADWRPSDEMEEDLRDTAYNVLENRHGGWEINEGSYGVITFLVPENKWVVAIKNRPEDDWSGMQDE